MNRGFQLKIVLDPFSLLFVNRTGVLKRIYCPFLVKCRFETENIKFGQTLAVDMVKTDLRQGITYVIKGKSYYHRYFEILA